VLSHSWAIRRDAARAGMKLNASVVGVARSCSRWSPRRSRAQPGVEVAGATMIIVVRGPVVGALGGQNHVEVVHHGLQLRLKGTRARLRCRPLRVLAGADSKSERFCGALSGRASASWFPSENSCTPTAALRWRASPCLFEGFGIDLGDVSHVVFERAQRKLRDDLGRTRRSEESRAARARLRRAETQEKGRRLPGLVFTMDMTGNSARRLPAFREYAMGAGRDGRHGDDDYLRLLHGLACMKRKTRIFGP